MPITDRPITRFIRRRPVLAAASFVALLGGSAVTSSWVSSRMEQRQVQTLSEQFRRNPLQLPRSPLELRAFIKAHQRNLRPNLLQLAESREEAERVISGPNTSFTTLDGAARTIQAEIDAARSSGQKLVIIFGEAHDSLAHYAALAGGGDAHWGFSSGLLGRLTGYDLLAFEFQQSVTNHFTAAPVVLWGQAEMLRKTFPHPPMNSIDTGLEEAIEYDPRFGDLRHFFQAGIQTALDGYMAAKSGSIEEKGWEDVLWIYAAGTLNRYPHYRREILMQVPRLAKSRGIPVVAAHASGLSDFPFLARHGVIIDLLRQREMVDVDDAIAAYRVEHGLQQTGGRVAIVIAGLAHLEWSSLASFLDPDTRVLRIALQGGQKDFYSLYSAALRAQQRSGVWTVTRTPGYELADVEVNVPEVELPTYLSRTYSQRPPLFFCRRGP